jgi:hypothetical protein
MANARSTSDLIKGALQHAGELTDGSSPYHALALRYINQAYLAVLSGSNEFEIDFGDPWHWARDTNPGIINLEAPVTGSVTFTNGSASIVFSSGPTASLTGWFIKVESRPTIYRISAHTAASTSATIDSVYLEETGSVAYTAFKLVYDLGENVLRLVEPLRHYQTQDGYYADGVQDRDKIYSIDLNRFRKDYPLTKAIEGVPSKFAILRQSESEFLVHMNYYPSEKMRVEYDRISIPEGLIDSDDSIPIIPRNHRDVLEFLAAHMVLIDKSDDKAPYWLDRGKQKLRAMTRSDRKQQSQTNDGRGRIITRPDQAMKTRRYFT